MRCRFTKRVAFPCRPYYFKGIVFYRKNWFIGSPVDLMIFDGATEKRDVIDIYLVEIKTGSGQLSKKQKTIREAIENQRIHWKPIIVPDFKWDVPDDDETY